MSKTKEIRNQSTNGDSKKMLENVPNDQEEPKSYKSVMKAFEMTHKRLYPELYKTKNK